MLNKKEYVLYHANCPDGFGAAFAAWLYYVIDGDLENVVFIPVQYNQPMPEMEDMSDVTILDFSYPAEDIRKLQNRMNDVVVLDHHKTALEKMDGVIDNWNVVVDLNKSGAVLSYEYYHVPISQINQPDKVPDFFLYLQDRDLWQWKLPYSREFSAGLALYPLDFKIWDNLRDRIPEIIKEGSIVLKYINQQVENASKNAQLVDFKGHKAMVMNATTNISELGNYLCKNNPEADFSATYFINEKGESVWSLRSIGDFDVSEVAKSLGGGGHKNSAGFTQKVSL